MSDPLSLPTSTSSPEGQAAFTPGNESQVAQKPGHANQAQVDQQKLEALITEKLNTFEGAPGKQELRQMMKEVVQELLQEKVGKGPEGQLGSGAMNAGSPKNPVAARMHPQGEAMQDLEQGEQGALKNFSQVGQGMDRVLHRGQDQSVGTDTLNPNLSGAMPLPQRGDPMVSTPALQNVQVSREAATQMIADIANQIVDRIQVNTNTLANMQEVRISFGNTILPNTEVVINLTGNQLNVTFVAGSQQAAQFLSSQNLSQLQNSLKTKLGEDKTVSVSLKKGEKEEVASFATEGAVRQKENSGDASSSF